LLIKFNYYTFSLRGYEAFVCGAEWEFLIGNFYLALPFVNGVQVEKSISIGIEIASKASLNSKSKK